MKFIRPLIVAWFTVSAACAAPVERMLPGELSAEEILDGAYPFPPSPRVEVRDDPEGFAAGRLSKVPPPGVHPRILISPEDLPGLRKRLAETENGRLLHAMLKARVEDSLRDPEKWSSRLYQKLAAGDKEGVLALVSEKGGFPPNIGHYQPWLYAIVMELFDAMIEEDAVRGKQAAAAIATYAELIRPGLEKALSAPMSDDVWRVRVSGPITGSGVVDQGLREGLGGHLLGYAYDFGYNFMTGDQRSAVRGVIASATRGRLWIGARLPHHFRNWNWIAVGLQQPLLALSIEGEEGYDPRVYKLGAEIARDYLTYGISASGESTEAVGYTQFGLVWGNPFFVAAARRGENLLVHGHHRAMLDWYVHSMEPGRFRFTSHGDGGDVAPAIWTLAMWRYFFPDDGRADFLWQGLVRGLNTDVENFHIIEPMLWAGDAKPVDHAWGADLGLATTKFDPVRGSLNARSAWSADAASVQFECRVDSVGGSHEHADRGNFTLFAHGRSWAKENFRSVETRHHNCVLIDGMGQGFWPGPGRWLGHEEKNGVLTAAADAAEAYNWWWPKQIVSEPREFVRFKYPRWESYGTEAAEFREKYAGVPVERDTRPAVVAFWKGFGKTDPRLWDEDSWPVRLPHNPVKRAFRGIAFHKGANPWLLVVDDIQKDENERLYEWLMQTGFDTEVVSISGNDIILGDAFIKRDAAGMPAPEKGERLLLVRVLDLKDPVDPHRYTTKPSFRLEAFERRDSLAPEARTGSLSGARSFGMDKRLVIGSRSVSPDFKILLYPHRHGDPLPVTAWDAATGRLTIDAGGEIRTLVLKSESGRTVIRSE